MSLHETLAALGLYALPGSREFGAKEIRRVDDDALVFEGTAGAVWKWLRAERLI